MKLLAIETSSSACSLALLHQGQITVSHKIAPNQQTELILPMIDQLLSNAGIKINELDAIAFGSGPGSFTGIRIACAIAQGLSFSANIPLIPISSMNVLAQTAWHQRGWQQVLVAIDARMQEIFWGAYTVNMQGNMKLVGYELVSKPKNCHPPENLPWYGVGDAWNKYSAEIPHQPLAIDTLIEPEASALISLALPKLAKKEWVRAREAEPHYLRDEVAVKEKNR